MNSINEKLAKLAAITGKDPITSNGVSCYDLHCFECPISARKSTSYCNMPTDRDLRNANIIITVKTYNDARELYPEVFL